MATMRQRKTAKILMENNGKSVSSAMKKAGYPASTAKNPQQITRSKSWQELMDEYFPRDYVAQKHQELFEAEEVVFIPHKGQIVEKKRPDFTARKAAAEMSYKLRGEFAPEKREITRRKYQSATLQELEEKVDKAKKQLGKK